MDPAFLHIESIVVCEQKNEVDPAAIGDLRELSQKATGQAMRAFTLVDAKVDNAEGARHLTAHPNQSELHSHLCDNDPIHRHDVSEMRRKLEIRPGRIAREAALQQ